MLVAAPRKGSPDARHIDEHLEELTRLVDTAGAEVVGRISQQVAAPSPATLIGEGKVDAPEEILSRWTWRLARATRKLQDRRAGSELPEA